MSSLLLNLFGTLPSLQKLHSLNTLPSHCPWSSLWRERRSVVCLNGETSSPPDDRRRSTWSVGIRASGSTFVWISAQRAVRDDWPRYLCEYPHPIDHGFAGEDPAGYSDLCCGSGSPLCSLAFADRLSLIEARQFRATIRRSSSAGSDETSWE